MSYTSGEGVEHVPRAQKSSAILQALEQAEYRDGRAHGKGLGAVYLLIVKLRPVLIVALLLGAGLRAESFFHVLPNITW